MIASNFRFLNIKLIVHARFFKEPTIIYRGREWIGWGRLTCLVLTLYIVGGDGLDGEAGMPCSDIIYRGRGWIRWGDWHALF